MNVILEKVNDFDIKGINKDGFYTDIGMTINGKKSKGASPMELVLFGLAGCTSVDILGILNKQKQELDSYKVEVNSVRAETIPKVFETINLNFVVTGKVELPKLKKAIILSKNKYCSVGIMLDKATKINCSIELNGEKYNLEINE